jgi:hypothetical protein
LLYGQQVIDIFRVPMGLPLYFNDLPVFVIF